jgi:hypothetical protein
MPDVIAGFIKVTEAEREYKTSRSTLDRRRDTARESGSAKLYRVFRLRAKDGEIFEQPPKEQVARLTKEGRVPEWYVSRSWLAKEFGKRANQESDAAGPASDRSADQGAGVVRQLEERIKDLKEQLETVRQEKKDLLQYAQADKQMFAQAAQQLTQVLALPAIAEANRNRTETTVPTDAAQSSQTKSHTTGHQGGKLQPTPLANQRSRFGLLRFFKRAS